MKEAAIVKSDFFCGREEEGDRTASTRDYFCNLIGEYTAIVLGMHVIYIYFPLFMHIRLHTIIPAVPHRNPESR